MADLIPTTKDISIFSGIVHVRRAGTPYHIDCGEVPEFNYKTSVEVKKLQTRRASGGATVRQDTVQTGAAITMKVKSLTAKMLAIGLMGESSQIIRPATPNQSKLFPGGAVIGAILDIGRIKISTIAVTDDASSPHSFTEGIHFTANAEAGLIKIIGLPASATANLVVDYEETAIVDADNLFVISALTNSHIEAGVIIEGTNTIGRRLKGTIGKLSFASDTDWALIGDDYADITLNAEVLYDSASPGFGWGKFEFLT